jgi:GNAT superfamily N-acetyltransferase
VGFAVFGAYRGIGERFGPFGVDAGERGTGLGKILLHLTMARMRAEGLHTAWFLWGDEASPAGHLYRKTGYEVTRRFQVMTRGAG